MSSKIGDTGAADETEDAEEEVVEEDDGGRDARAASAITSETDR